MNPKAGAKPESKADGKPETIDPSRWVEEYGDYLFRFAQFRVRRTDIAEELVQETFLAAWKGIERFEGKSSLKTWLVTILKNKIMDHFRKASRDQEVSATESSEGGDERMDALFNRFGIWRTLLEEWKTTPEGLIEQQGFVEQVRNCIDNLPQRMKEVFTLRSVEDVPTSEVCEMMNISENNLWVILYRARMQLRSCLDMNWFKAR